ncbi:MAG: insulinase family protein [Nitrospirae bacterium]|nr:insulinase family protein [Nitrospirota bacterium]
MNSNKVIRQFFTTAIILAILSFSAESFALDIAKQTLPNGLKVFHSERKNLPIVVLTLLIKTSSLNETDEKAGTASLTAKLLTEGTTNRSSIQISEEIDFLGASIGAGANKDYTTVSLGVLKKDLQKGFELFADILLKPSFPEEELKRKKEQLKGMLKRQEDEPGFLADKAFIREVFGSHPYGRLSEGSVESIDKITRKDLADFYRANYRPDNALLTVAGDISKTELDALIDRYLKSWTVAEVAAPSTHKAPENIQRNAPKVVIIDKNITQANIILGHAGISRENPDYYAVSVMNYILGGGGFASRLMKIVRDDMGLAYSIHSSFASNKYPGAFEVEVQTKNESADVVVKEILKQMQRMRSEYVSEQELSDAKAYLTGSFPRRLETTSKIVDFISAVQFFNLGDDYIQKYPSYIKSITKEDVRRVAEKYLNPEAYVLVLVGRQSEMKLHQLQAP